MDAVTPTQMSRNLMSFMELPSGCVLKCSEVQGPQKSYRATDSKGNFVSLTSLKKHFPRRYICLSYIVQSSLSVCSIFTSFIKRLTWKKLDILKAFCGLRPFLFLSLYFSLFCFLLCPPPPTIFPIQKCSDNVIGLSHLQFIDNGPRAID